MALRRGIFSTSRILQSNLSTRNARRCLATLHSPLSGPGVAFYPNGNRAVHGPRLIPERQRPFHTSAYVHPLSQVVLQHLQSRHGRWVAAVGLNTGLQLKDDGTFVLRFPGKEGGEGETEAAGRSADARAAESMTDHGSIWTVYEAAENKHFLCVSKGRLVGQYLLQDNTTPAWHTEKRSTPERIQDAVDGMIEQIQDMGSTVSNE